MKTKLRESRLLAPSGHTANFSEGAGQGRVLTIVMGLGLGSGHVWGGKKF